MTIVKWRVGYGEISEFEILSETDKSLTYQPKPWGRDEKLPKPRRIMKSAGGYQYFDTRGEAVQYLRERWESSLVYHKREVENLTKKLEMLK